MRTLFRRSFELGLVGHVLTALAIVAALVASSPAAQATIGTCDTVGPVEVEATTGNPGPTSYATLGAALTAINAGTHTGIVNVEICGSTTEGATPATLNSSGAGSASYTSLSIVPLLDGLSVSGNPATGFGVIQLNGADNVTIDGDNPNSGGTNRNLTVANTAATATTLEAVIRVATSATAPFDSNNNLTIKNLILTGNVTGGNAAGITAATTSANQSWGIVVGPNGGSSVTALTSETGVVAAGVVVNSLLVDNNQINQVGRGVSFLGSTASSSTDVTVTNNAIGSTTAPTPATPPYTAPTATVYVKGISVQGTNAVTVSGNTITDIISYVQVVHAAVELPANIGNGTVSVANNSITHVVLNTVLASGTSFGAQGAAVLSALGTYTVSGNTITDIQSFDNTTASYPNGIVVSTTALSGLIENNKVTTVTNRSTSTFGCQGISVNAGDKVTIRNNFVADINQDISGGVAFSPALQVVGIRLNAGNSHKVYHNSVNMFGPTIGGAGNNISTSCFSIAAVTLTGIDVRDNIFSNTMTGGGATSVAHIATMLPGTGTRAMNLTWNNNALYSGSTANVHGICHVGTSYVAVPTGAPAYTGIYTAANFNPNSTAGTTNLRFYTSTLGNLSNDNGTLAFATPTTAPFTSPTNLHISTGVTPTVLESNGVNVGVTTDIDNDVRPGPAGSVNGGASAPDLGADEFDGVPLDNRAPIVFYTPFLRDIVAATRSVGGVTATDLSGVNILPATRPRLYYKKSSDAANTVNDNTNATAGWKYVEADGAGGSPFSFTIDYSLLLGGGGVALGDVIQYFVVAQDNVVPTPNVAINSGVFAATPTSVALTAAAFPVTGTINSYTIVATLSGTRTVCTAGCDYTSLTLAGGVFADINAKVLSGNLDVQIAGNLAAETGANSLLPEAENPPGPWTVKIYPTGVARTVAGTGAGGFAVPIAGGDNLTIDGSIGGTGVDRSLTISNPNTANGTGALFFGSQGPGAGCANITVKNCIIKSGSIGTTANFTFGVFVGDATGAAAGADNDNFTFQNNQVTLARTGVQMVGTLAGPDDNPSITGNLIGDPVIANSIGRVGLSLSTMSNLTLTGNTIRNIFLSADNASLVGASLTLLTGTTNISQNTITGLQTNTTTAGAVPLGLLISNSSGVTISQNTIDGVVGGFGGTGTQGPFALALNANFTNSIVERNIVTNVSYNGASAVGARGIDIATGSPASNLTLRNNAVSNVRGNSANSFTGDAVVGVRITGATGGLNFYFNSFGLASGSFAGAATGTLSGALYIGASAVGLDLKDNILASNLVNSNAAAAKTYAIFSDAPASAFVSNNNDLFASGSQGVLGFVGAADRTTLTAWQTATGGDGASLAVDPIFNSATNLQPSIGSPVVGAGAPAGGVGIDILGTPRSGSTPTIGAYETAADTSGPVISYTPFTNTTSTSNRNLTATITDGSGVPTTGIGLPVLYWKKNALAYNSAQGTFGGGTYSFLIDYSIVGGVVPGDTISYYVAAQDNFGPPNVSVNPSAGASGLTFDPPAASTPPSPPNSYTILPTISGIRTVCASGCNFSTLTGAGGAFAVINGSVATGNIEIQIAGDLTAGEDGSVGLNPLTEEPTGSNFTVKIYPTGVPLVPDAVRLITGSSATSLIRLNGADRVTIDGSGGGAGSDRSMTITNTNAGTTSAVVYLQSNLTDGATNNTIKNLNVVGSNTFAAAVNGTLFGIGSSGPTISISTFGTGNNVNNTFQNNNISKSQYGIFSAGVSAANKNSGTVITQNSINTASPNGIVTGGILVFFDNGVQITRNDVGNILRHNGTTGLTVTAFGIAAGIVPNNTLTTFTGNEVVNAVITRNKVDGVVQLNATGYSAFGIVLCAATSGTSQIANNMVSGVRSAATPSDFTGGIVVGGGTGSTTQVYGNSVSMTGSRNAATDPSYALAIGPGDPIVDVRDNALSNRQTSTSTGKHYAIASGATTFANLTSNNNDLDSVADGTSHFVGQTTALGNTGVDRNTLANWQAATTKDGASISADPLFISASDLHINLCSSPASPVNNAGVFIAAIPTDFDGDTRSGTTPDIGADEMTPAAVPCNDSNTCTTDTCIPATGCQFTAVANGTFCGDAGTQCTNQDTCQSGVCQDNGIQPDGIACGSSSDTNCDNPDTCLSGACALNYEPNGFPCPDGLACTTNDTCNGSGSCINTPVNCSDGSACTTDSCVEPSGTCSYALSGSCDINGSLLYYRNNVGPVEPSTKPIPIQNVTRTSTFEATSVATTNSSGNYSFTNEGGNVSLTPAQVRLMTDEDECHNSITAADASQIAQASIGAVTFTANQAVAGDVSNNGSITSFDAALTAQKAVASPCLSYLFPVRTATGSDWAFRPVSRSFSPLTGVAEDYTFLGVLFGDVTGNWTAPVLFSSENDAAKEPSVETTIAEASPRIPTPVLVPSGTVRAEGMNKGATLYVAAAPVQNADGTWSVVLGMQRADGILGLDMNLHFDSKAIQVVGVAAAGISSGWTVAGRADGDNYQVALFGIEPLQGTGSFLNVTYSMTSGVNGLPFGVAAQANEGRIPISWSGVPRVSPEPQVHVEVQ